MHLRIWVGIAFKSESGLLRRYCTYKTSPREAKPYWKPAKLGCKVFLGLLQSEKPEISAELWWAQGLAAHCKQELPNHTVAKTLTRLFGSGLTPSRC